MIVDSSTERITGIHRDTVLRLLNIVGERCERVMAEKIQGIKVGYVEADEIWGFIQKKRRAQENGG
ncbi:MAG: hypothetical protein SF339_01070 [Blastocatellia bacterium]|nr:hypothetical protein [Blastocatellia bacterium]